MGRTMAVRRVEMVPEKLGFFRWGRIAGKVLLTTDAGEWLFLSEDEFSDLLAGRIGPDHARFAELQSKGILRQGLDLDDLAAKVSRRVGHVTLGTHLHIVILTLRCNQACAYCHASRAPADAAAADMTPATAERVVDLALQSASPRITFEFQGGEPLLNFAVLRHLVEVARHRNESLGKRLEFSLVSNFTAMTEDIAEWLIANEILVCTSLDGPKELHNANRRWTAGNAYEEVVRWIDYFNRRYVEAGRDPRLWHIDALMTTTRKSLRLWREIVDEYVARGIKSIHVRPLNPTGFARTTWRHIGYTTDQYLAFYERLLSDIIQRNLDGVEIAERTASILLTKILTADDPAYVDIQSPCGAGTGQVAYNFDGRVFPCDEARMVDASGDPIFALGAAGDLTYPEIIGHPTVRSIAVASLLDSLPMCAECWNKPYCGVCPLHNFMSTGDLFGQRPRSPKCTEYMTISRLLFERLAADSNGRIAELFTRWTVQRPRMAGAAGVAEEKP